MKSLLYTLVFLLLLVGTGSAQPESRFPLDSTSRWKIYHIRNGVSDEKEHIEGDQLFSYFIDGDTIIGAFTYFRVYKSGVYYLDEPFRFEGVYVGALRDRDNKFYFIEKKKSTEVMLYDFTANIDDTIQVPYDGVFEEKIVSSIDTLPDGRKMIHFNPKEPMMGCGDQYIIEGIGGSGGLLEGPVCNHFWTFDNHLVCYTREGMLVYHDNNFQFNCDGIDEPVPGDYLDETCVWRVDKQYDSDSTASFEKIDYAVCGDTLIGGHHYMKLCKRGFQLLIGADGSYTSGVVESLYAGAIREEGKRFYFIEKGSTYEILLYDFTLKAGDTANGKSIVSIDSVLDGRNAFYFSDNYWQDLMIEGIGSDKGLLELGSESSMLICFMKNGAPVYHNGSGNECNLSFDAYSFSGCDKITVQPANPREGDEIKVISRVCYPVGDQPSYVPTLNFIDEEIVENTIQIKGEFGYDDRNNSVYPKIVVPLFDTITIGRLPAGEYFIEMNVNTVHSNNGNPFTVEFDKNMYFPFIVIGSADVDDPTTGNRCKVYPSKVSDFFMVECNGEEKEIQSIGLYTISGTKVEPKAVEKGYDNNTAKVDISNLTGGMYLVVVETGKARYSQKMIRN